MTKHPIINGVGKVDWPENRGRVEGSKNQSTARRDEAVSKGASYVENGMKTKHAAQRCIDEFGMNLTVEHMSRMIANHRNANVPT